MTARRWPNHRDQVTPLISLDTHYRRVRQEALQEAYNEGTAIGFFYGVAAAGFMWAVLSGLLASIGYVILSGLVHLVQLSSRVSGL